ncbi:MAG: TonB-dependent receptor [Bacteroidota bacterium]
MPYLKSIIIFECTPNRLISVLDRIERETDYRFFYLETWIEGIKVSGDFQDRNLDEVLTDLFDDTLLNFYMGTDRQIILTQNNSIYDELPQGFFKRNTGVVNADPSEETIKAPIFYKEAAVSEEIIPTRTVRIGKEDKDSNRRTLVLSGTITNETNGGAAPNVTLRLLGTNQGTQTNDQGQYQLELPPGLNRIEVSSINFQKKRYRVILYNDGTLDIGLKESVEDLQEVLIQTNRDLNVKNTNTGVTKIDVDEIKNIPLVLGERDIFKVAATLPGISSAGEGASGYNVRGGRTDQNLVRLDDAVIYNPSHFFGIFSAINPFTTEDVTIYKGHVPAQLGGRLSSVFDMTTKDANVQKVAGEASIGPVTSSLVLEAPLAKGRSGILIGGRATYSDWILRNLDEEELRKSKASFYDGVVKFNQKINESNDLRATVHYSRDDFSITSDSVFGYSNRLAALKWNFKMNPKHEGSLSITNSQYQFDIEFDGQTNTDFELGYVIDESELRTQFQYRPNGKHTFTYGLSSKLYGVEPGEIRPGGDGSIITPVTIDRERGLESAVFVSDLFQWSDKFSIEAGLRFSTFQALGAGNQNIYQDGVPRSDATLLEVREFGPNEVIESYAAPEVRVSGRYLIKPNLSLKGSFNSSYQYIHQLSTNTTVSPIDTWKLSDANIRPQNALQYALGVFKNFEDNMYELSIEGYYKKLNDLLDYKVGAQLLLNEKLEQEVLQGDGKAYGVELLLKKTRGRWNGWVGYTYSRSFVRLDSEFAEERVNDGDFFPSNFDKPHDFTVVSNFKLSKRYSFSANFVYQTGRPVTIPVGNFVINDTEFVLFGDRNQFRIPDFYRLDLSFNMEGNHKKKKLAHSFWNFSIYNVLGRNNPYSVFFVTESGEVKAYQSSIFAVPIPTISYNLKF